jgi:hypothetical protein
MPRLGLIFLHLAIADGYNDSPLPSARPTFSEPTRSFCVALRSQPVDATAACKPFVNVSLALKTPDVPNFDSGIVGLDLPVSFCDAAELEGDTRRFAHGPIMPIFGIRARWAGATNTASRGHCLALPLPMRS